MKKTVLSCVFAALALTFQAQISISPTNTQPHASAMLDVQSTNKGMLVPRMTTAQRNAINNPAKGLMVFDNNTNSFWYHNGTAWAAVGGSDVPASGIVFSETAVNANLSNAGFAYFGKTKMLIEPATSSSKFAWTGEATIHNAPVSSYYNVGFWTGTHLLVWSSFSGVGAKYDITNDSWLPFSTVNAPNLRQWCTSVWTGTDLICWGGQLNNGNFTNTGAKYNLASNTWTPITTTNAPSGRRQHSAVWTGTEMIVWGGHDASSLHLNNGAKYNPISNTWVAMTINNAPSGRNSHTAVWSGTEMIIWGGQDANSLPEIGGKYNPLTDTWSLTSNTNCPPGRNQHSAIWNGTKMIVFGGIITGGMTNTGGIYNPTNDTWTSMANSTIVRKEHSAVWTGNQMIVWGGSNNNQTATATGAIYNFASNTWEALSAQSNPFIPNNYHIAVWTGNEMIVWGGLDYFNLAETAHFLSPGEYKTLYLFIKN